MYVLNTVLILTPPGNRTGARRVLPPALAHSARVACQSHARGGGGGRGGVDRGSLSLSAAARGGAAFSGPLASLFTAQVTAGEGWVMGGAHYPFHSQFVRWLLEINFPIRGSAQRQGASVHCGTSSSRSRAGGEAYY